jgi:hypothetical protein
VAVAVARPGTRSGGWGGEEEEKKEDIGGTVSGGGQRGEGDGDEGEGGEGSGEGGDGGGGAAAAGGGGGGGVLLDALSSVHHAVKENVLVGYKWLSISGGRGESHTGGAAGDEERLLGRQLGSAAEGLAPGGGAGGGSDRLARLADLRIPRSDIHLTCKVAVGSTGQVYKGKYNGMTIAVKV